MVALSPSRSGVGSYYTRGSSTYKLESDREKAKPIDPTTEHDTIETVALLRFALRFAWGVSNGLVPLYTLHIGKLD